MNEHSTECLKLYVETQFFRLVPLLILLLSFPLFGILQHWCGLAFTWCWSKLTTKLTHQNYTVHLALWWSLNTNHSGSLSNTCAWSKKTFWLSFFALGLQSTWGFPISWIAFQLMLKVVIFFFRAQEWTKKTSEKTAELAFLPLNKSLLVVLDSFSGFWKLSEISTSSYILRIGRQKKALDHEIPVSYMVWLQEIGGCSRVNSGNVGWRWWERLKREQVPEMNLFIYDFIQK